MTTFTHQDGQYVEVAGARLYCEQQGNPQGPALVFLHGGFGDIETFNAITPALAEHYRLIGIDSRGQGKSTLGHLPLTYQRLQLDVEAVARQLGLERFSLVGHSDGGIAALRIAAAGSAGIEKLVTIGAHWQLKADDPVRGMYSRVTGARWRELFPHSYERYLQLNPEPDFDRLAVALRELWLDSGEQGYPNETVCGITADLLVIHGDEDRLVTRANACELADRVANAQLLNIPFTGHSPHEDHPQWVMPALKALLGL
ncbi:MAG: alpha/beta fold hydrolase [Pseudomonas palmensis]|uniref:alpha/beta fold hydrolase n=1 Tax=Pseudomonas palmensis TaxID=2815362 RepID=UPI003D0A875B